MLVSQQYIFCDFFIPESSYSGIQLYIIQRILSFIKLFISNLSGNLLVKIPCDFIALSKLNFPHIFNIPMTSFTDEIYWINIISAVIFCCINQSQEENIKIFLTCDWQINIRYFKLIIVIMGQYNHENETETTWLD